jgi:Tfp pilus assembly protein PilF
MGRAIAYLGKGELQKAITDCDAAIRLDTKDLNLFALRSMLYSKKGDSAKAAEDMGKG